MRKVTRAIASMEAIDFQRKKSFYNNLVGVTEDLRERGETSREPAEDIKQLLFKEMGIYLHGVEIDFMGGPNAYMTLSTMSKHLTILNDFRKAYVEQVNEHSRKKRRNTFGGTSLYGSVDLEKSQVSGDFSKMPFTMGISVELLTDNRFTIEEIAAIVLHEIGHAFTFFEYLSQSVRRSVIIANSTEEFFAEKNKQKRIQILDLTRKELSIKDDEFDTLLELEDTHKDRRAYQTIVEAKAIEFTRNETGESIYTKRSAEQLADQFAARHGAARDLVTGLDKLFKYGIEKRSTPVYLALEVGKIVGLIATGAITVVGNPVLAMYGIFIFFGIIATQFPSDEYDRTKERLTKVRRQLVEQSKLRNLSREERERITEDADYLEGILDQYKEHKAFIELFFLAVSSPWRGKKRKVLEIQKELEALSNNELYLSAVKLKNISYNG